MGCCLRPSIAATTKKGRKLSLTPTRTANSSLYCVRKSAIAVTSASITARSGSRRLGSQGGPSTRSTRPCFVPLPDGDKTPVAVLTGFLGSGKTTLLQRLLTHPALGETAVILNELGEVSIDHHLLRRV